MKDTRATVTEPAAPPHWLAPTLRQLAELLELRADWVSYGTRPVEPFAAGRAIGLLDQIMDDRTPAPAVVPTKRGGVQYEWHTRGIDLEVEVSPTGVLSALFEDKRSGDQWKTDAIVELAPIVAALDEISRRQ